MSLLDTVLIGLYLNPFVAGEETYRQRIYSIADSGYLNALVIDVRTEHGKIWYASEIEFFKNNKLVSPILPSLRELVEEANAHSIYLIARIVCFVDRTLPLKIKERSILNKETKKPWKDFYGNFWLNPFDTLNWNDIISVAEEVAKNGFNEIHFDYVRFPSEGNISIAEMKNPLNLTKEEAIQGFLRTAFLRLYKYNIQITPCLFGFAAFWKIVQREGQSLKLMASYSDNLAFMLYPSHFGRNFLNDGDDRIRDFMIYYFGVQRARKGMKPFKRGVEVYVQGFNYLTRNSFGPEYILNQIKGALSSGVKKIIVWHAGGEYAPTIKAFKILLQENN